MIKYLSEHAGGGELFTPAMVKYNGNGRATLGITTSGNKVFGVVQMKRESFTGASFERLIAVRGSSNSLRFLLTIYSSDYATVANRNKVSLYVANAASTTLALLISDVEVCNDVENNLYISIDFDDVSDYVFKVNGVDADDTGHADRVLINGVPDSGLGTITLASLSATAMSEGYSGYLGYTIYDDNHRTDWETFIEADGTPRNIDGSALMFYNPHGGHSNRGTIGDLVPADDPVTISDLGNTGHPILGLPTIGDAVPADLAAGKIAWVDGARIVGTGAGAGQPDLTGLNLILKSRDLTDVAWADVQSPTATYDQIGLDGAANTATRLTDATGTHDGKAQNGIANGGVVVTARWFVKIEVGQPFSLMDMNGIASTYFMYNIVDAEGENFGLAFGASSTGVTYYKIRSQQYPGWWELGIQLDNPGNDAGLEIYPARGSTFGANIGGTTGSCTIGNMELYDGLTIADVIMQPAEFND
jgi:hypothetical protein